MCATLRIDEHAAGRVGEGHKSPLWNGSASSGGECSRSRRCCLGAELDSVQ